MNYSLNEALKRIFEIETWKPIAFNDFVRRYNCLLDLTDTRGDKIARINYTIGNKFELTDAMKQKISNAIVKEFACNCWLAWNVKYTHFIGVMLSDNKRRVEGIEFYSDDCYSIECVRKSDLILFYHNGNIECYAVKLIA